MANRHDLLIRLDSEFSDKGFRSAEQSAKTLERELNKQEAAQRSLANMQMAAAREQQRLDAARMTSMANVGKGFTAIGLLAAAGLGMAAKSAVDWESAWAGVTKTVDGSSEELAQLEGELRGLARTLPATHEEIAGVAEAAGQLGVKRQDIASFTKTMIDLGVSTNLSADEAATGLAQLGNIMGVLPSQAGRAGAALVALGNDGASTEADILAMSLRIAGAGKAIGLSEAQVMGYANALSSMGIEAESGGSAISRVMISIAQSVETGGDELNNFSKVAGMTTKDFAARFKTDAAGAVAAFITGLGNMQKSGQSTFGVMDKLGLSEIRVRDALLRASSASDLLTDSIELGSSAWEANTALTDEANKRYETTASRLKIARNELNDAAIDIGANVLPALAAVADRVGFLSEAFHGLPDGVKEAVTVLGGFVMTVGLLGGAALILIPKLTAMNATLAASGRMGAVAAGGLSKAGAAMMGPWGIALAGASIAMGIFAEKQYEAKQAVDEAAAALDQQTGAITENYRALTIKELQDSGVMRAARELGLNLNDLTEAALGNSEAMRRVAEGLTAVTPEVTGYNNQANAQIAIIDKVRNALGGQNDKLREAREQLEMKREAMGTDVDATDAATLSTEDFTAAQQLNLKTTVEAADEIQKLIKAVEGYGDAVNEAMDANSAYQASLDDAADALEKNGKTANRSRTAIDLNTQAGRENDRALRDIAKSALAAATANFENGTSVKSVTANVEKARGQFVAMAEKMGLSRAAANKLADQLGLTKANVGKLSDAITKTPTAHSTKMDVETAAAMAKLTAFQQRINALRGNNVQVGVRYVDLNKNPTSKAGGITNATGNLIEFSGSFSGGGYAPIGPQYPQIRAAGGEGMTWGEHGAGPWEAYISGNPDKKSRSLAIWEDTGRRLGAFEAMRSQPAVMVEGSKTVDRSVNVGQIVGPDADEVVRRLERRQRQRDALNPDWG